MQEKKERRRLGERTWLRLATGLYTCSLLYIASALAEFLLYSCCGDEQ